jgi:hypothetical protein
MLGGVGVLRDNARIGITTAVFASLRRSEAHIELGGNKGALAIAKVGDEERVLKTYRQAGGRQRGLNLIVTQANAARRDTRHRVRRNERRSGNPSQA